MRKEEKKEKQFPGKMLISGAFIFFTTYIIGIMLSAWLISKKLISQDAVHSVLSVMCLVGSFFSFWISCQKIKWGTLIFQLLDILSKNQMGNVDYRASDNRTDCPRHLNGWKLFPVRNRLVKRKL